MMIGSEGNCPKCGQPLGISGTCYACAIDQMPMVTKRKDGPTCKECGAAMYHSRLYGYACMRDPRHEGIIWPSFKNEAANDANPEEGN